MLPKLVINQGDIKNPWQTLGMTELLTYLIESNLFDISYHRDRISTGKGERGTILYYNDKKIYLDFWEYMMPSYTMAVVNANFDLIIKLQHSAAPPENFEKACQRKNVFLNLTAEQRKNFYLKVSPWTFFASRMIQQFMGREDELKPVPIERVAFFCGKGWKCRHGFRNKIKAAGIEYYDSSQEFRSCRPLKDDEYIQKMRSSKYGLVLRGRNSWFTEAKNRREIDYMILKKPLLLNYKPFYYNPLVEGKHYIYIDDKVDLNKIEENHDINAIAQNGYEWYLNNASKMGSAKTFLQMMKDKFGENNS